MPKKKQLKLNKNLQKENICSNTIVAKRYVGEEDYPSEKLMAGSPEEFLIPLNPDNLNTPARCPTSKSFISPAIEHRVSKICSSAQEEDWDSPGGGVMRSAAICWTLGDRIFDESCTKPARSLIFHTSAVHEADLVTLSAIRGRHKTKSGSETNVHKMFFEATGESVTVCNRLFETGSKASKVPGFGTYTKIAKTLIVLGRDFGDGAISDALFDILNNRKLTLFDELSIGERISLNKFMSKLCYLLFSTEVDRFEAVSITNAMFLELVKAGQCKMSDITELPLSAKKAVQVARKVNSVSQKGYYTGWTYDFYGKELPDINSDIVRSLLIKNHELLKDWFKLHHPRRDIKEFSIAEITSIITPKIKQWFGLEIKPFRMEKTDFELNDSGIGETDESDEEISNVSSGHDMEDFSILGVSYFTEDTAL